MDKFITKRVSDGWAVIDDRSELWESYPTLPLANREAARLQGIWDRASKGRDDLIEACRAALPHLQELCKVPVGDDKHYGDRQALNKVVAALAQVD